MVLIPKKVHEISKFADNDRVANVLIFYYLKLIMFSILTAVEENYTKTGRLPKNNR